MSRRTADSAPPARPRYLLLWWAWIFSRMAFGWSDPDQKKWVGVVSVSLVETLGLMTLLGPVAYPWMANTPMMKPALALVMAALMGLNHFVILSDKRWREFLRYREQRRKGGASQAEVAWAGTSLALYLGIVVVAFAVYKMGQ